MVRSIAESSKYFQGFYEIDFVLGIRFVLLTKYNLKSKK